MDIRRTGVLIVWLVIYTPVDCGNSLWIRDVSMNGKMVTRTVLSYHTVTHKTHCAQTCAMHISCSSFYLDITTLICYLHDDVYTLTSPHIDAPVKYYVRHDKVLTKTAAGTTELTTPTITAIPCPPTYTSNSGYCFKISRNERNWKEARSICQSTPGADLLILDSLRKQTFFNNHISNKYTTIQFGVYDINKHGPTFQLVDGRREYSLSFTYWGTGEPNNLDGGNLCGFLYWENRNTELRWNDRGCHHDSYYICEVLL